MNRLKSEESAAPGAVKGGRPILKCEHEIASEDDYQTDLVGGVLYIRYICVEGHLTSWALVGDAPTPDSLGMEGEGPGALFEKPKAPGGPRRRRTPDGTRL